MRRLLPALAAAAALAMPMAHAPAALAGTYQFEDDTSQSVDGWLKNTENGYWLCSFASRPGPCTDADVGQPTALRIFAQGDVKSGDEAFWYWVAPPTVTIDSGSVKVNYSTTTDTRVFMKVRLRNFAFASQPRLHTANDDGTTSWNIPGGNAAVGLFLTSQADHTFTNKWSNTLRVLSMSATLRDDTAPTAELGGDLAAGRWLNQTQPVCTTVAAADAGAGVMSSQLRDPLAGVLDEHRLPDSTAMQPGAADYQHQLCLTPSRQSDGVHQLLVRVADAAGESVDVPLTVSTDSHPPVATATTPAETTDRRPLVAFSADGGPSGLSSLEATVDGQPMTVEGGHAQLLPLADLAYGAHTVSWSATDGAGNHRDGSWTFHVVDDAPPTLSDPAPAAGAALEGRRPPIAFTLADTGSGIDPASLRVLLDGSDVAPFGALVDGRFGYTPPADLGYGHHTVSVAVSDRFGNAMAPRQWGFDVVDTTPPLLTDVRPDDGASSSDRTPAISVAIADAGIGVDPASITVQLDGVDVTALGGFAGGRFTLTPAAPLGYGSHSVAVRAADRSGNSARVGWSFTVHDETPPTISNRSPKPGTTVTGPVAVSFEVADDGTGVDNGSLRVLVDGSDVMSWATFSGGHFVYDPGAFAAGVHTVSVTVADTSGNTAGPVMWQFASVDPARIELAATSVPVRLVAGQQATLRFRATANGAGLDAAQVRLTSRAAGGAGFGDPHTAGSDANGEVSFTVRPTATTDYRAELVDSGTVSVVRTVVVAQRVMLAPASGRVRRGTPIRLSGAVTPARAGEHVRVQLLTHRGWVTVATPRLTVRSRYAASLVPRVAGRYLFRVVAAADDRNAAGTSRTVAVRVR